MDNTTAHHIESAIVTIGDALKEIAALLTRIVTVIEQPQPPEEEQRDF